MIFLDSTFNVVCKDEYNDYYQQATVDLDVQANGVVNWTVAMHNDHVGSKGRAVVLYVKVAGKELFNTGYLNYNNRGSKNWLTFPTGHDTSESGSFTLSNTAATSFDVEILVCCMQSDTTYGTSVKKTLTRNFYVAGSSPAISIVNHKNNTCTISGNLGIDGTNNAIQSAALYYTLDGSDPADDNNSSRYYYNTHGSTAAAGRYMGAFVSTLTSGISYSKKITISNTCTVRAYVRCSFTHNITGSSAREDNVKFYIAPGNPGVPKLSYKKSRLTVKEPWTFTWSAAKAGNDNTPVVGYRIRLWKNGSEIPIREDGSGKILSSNLGPSYLGSNYYYYYDSASTTLITDPTLYEFKPKDTVQLNIYAYALNGAGEQLWSGNGDTPVFSSIYTVQNAGIVRIKADGTWKEGQVYVKVDNTWKEAETVNVKTADGWKESQ